MDERTAGRAVKVVSSISDLKRIQKEEDTDEVWDPLPQNQYYTSPSCHSKPSGLKKEEYAAQGHTFEYGFRDNPYEDLEPMGVRYLLQPTIPTTGMLAAYNIFPFANNDTNPNHYFQAYGITLATKNQFGKVIHYHGNATIRISDPDPGVPP